MLAGYNEQCDTLCQFLYSLNFSTFVYLIHKNHPKFLRSFFLLLIYHELLIITFSRENADLITDRNNMS